MHNFCGGCFGQLARKHKNCPSCKQKVSAVSKNILISDIIEQYLRKNPDQRREKSELKKLEMFNVFTAQISKLRDVSLKFKKESGLLIYYLEM